MGMSGRALARAFYFEAVQPLLPCVPYAAAFLGPGSDVLGFDDDTSTDHDWGPRCRIFVPDEKDIPAFETALAALPDSFMGYPVWYGRASDGVRTRDGDGREHLVKIHTIDGYLADNLGAAHPKSDMDWLSFPDQRLLEWTSGEVYHDEMGLNAARERFCSLPENVRVYRIAAAWSAISEEAAFVGRTGDTGDDIGSRLIAARLARRAMLLAFLLEGVYPPYMKWFGTAFGRLCIAARMQPILDRLLRADEWPARTVALGEIWDTLIDRQSELLGISIQKTPAPYRGAYWTHDLSAPMEAARAMVKPPLDALPIYLGSVNEWLDNTPVMSNSRIISDALKHYIRS